MAGSGTYYSGKETFSSGAYAQVYCTFTVGDKDSSGRIPVSWNLKGYCSNSGYDMYYEWWVDWDTSSSGSGTDLATGSGDGYSTVSLSSGSANISTGSTSAQTIYLRAGARIHFSTTTGSYHNTGFNAFTASAYEIPFSKKQLSISPTTQTMGGVLSISETDGTGVSSTTRTWECGNSSGTFNTGSYTVAISSFEPLTPNSNSVVATFSTYSSGDGGSGTSSVNVTLNVPSNYLPTATHTYEYIDDKNGGLVAGFSKLKVTLDPQMTPADNSATISSYELYSVNPFPTTDTIPISVSDFTKNEYDFTSVVLPTKEGSPSYQFTLTFRITDSRGNVVEYTTGAFRVSNFVPPNVQITNVNRSTATTGLIELTIIGESSSNPTRIDNTENTIALLTIDNGETSTSYDVKNDLVETDDGYTLSYSLSGLTSGDQYNVTFTYKDTTMVSYGESSYNYKTLLSTLAMPISLYDNGSRMAVSFGEECKDDYGYDTVINFAKDSYIRFIKDDEEKIVKAEEAFGGQSCPYNVGDIYITTLSSDPSDIWKGTSWLQLKDTFLLGAGDTYSGGDTGGEATHTLTIEEMPSHTHEYDWHGKISNFGNTGGNEAVAENNVWSNISEATGGGQAHNNMPPYLVVYMWQRTA